MRVPPYVVLLVVSLGKSKEGLGLLERGVLVHPQSVDIVLRQLLPGLGIPMLQGVKNGRVVGIVAHDGDLVVRRDDMTD